MEVDNSPPLVAGSYKSKSAGVGEGEGEGSMHVSVMKHARDSLEVMNSLRAAGKLCDVTLLAADDAFVAHRVVLAGASPYFRAMFCRSGMRESQTLDVPLGGVSPDVLAALVDFAYTAEVRVTEANVCALLPAATMFQMAPVVDACCAFLERRLAPDNCIGIADFAQAHGCHALYARARAFVYARFPAVARHDEFRQLSASQLVQVLKRDELGVRCESEAYGAALAWVRHDPARRLSRLPQLLAAVRCHFLAPAFLAAQLRHCELLRRAPASHQQLTRVAQHVASHRRCPDRRRRNPAAPPAIYAAGGYLRHSLSSLECFTPDDAPAAAAASAPGDDAAVPTWYKLASLPQPRSGVAACVVHGLLYVIGGRNNSPDGNVDSAATDCYDPYTNQWRPTTDMSTPRNRVGAGNIDGQVYAVGGSHACEHHNSVERWVNTHTSVLQRARVRLAGGDVHRTACIGQALDYTIA